MIDQTKERLRTGDYRKYGQRLGTITEMASSVEKEAKVYSVNINGKQRKVVPIPPCQNSCRL